VRRIELYDVSTIERPTGADLEALARRRLDARRRGYELVLTGVGERLRLLLAATGLDEVFALGNGEAGTDGLSTQPEPEG
jgi:anti-anti-sigma regulatory factor